MDLLTAATSLSDRHRRRPSTIHLRTLRIAVGASLAVHSALVIGAVLLPATVPGEDPAPMVMVDVVDVTPGEFDAPPGPRAQLAPTVTRRFAPTPIAVASRARPVVRASHVATIHPETVPIAASPDQIPGTADPDRTAVAAMADRTAVNSPAVLVATASTGLTGGARGAASGSGHAEPHGHAARLDDLDDTQRSSLIGRYRDVLRNRIRNGFRYPAEARELELVGQVVVHVTVDRGGRLLAARLRGSCPHPVLCDDALRTIRAASPFSPIPRDVGESLQIEVPLNYVFE